MAGVTMMQIPMRTLPKEVRARALVSRGPLGLMTGGLGKHLNVT